ncbi:MAG: N-acyl homoserine lactonase family protein [Clostridiales bacterium]|nr:N-acyl homoserine lactonase family protein [Clostridiales bacterium]
MKLYLLYCGKLDLPSKQGNITPLPGEDGPISVPCWAYLVEHEKGLVLIDCGQHNTAVAKVREEDRIVNRLAELGYTPDDVKFVVLTHMHIDHAADMELFPNSTFVVRREELRQAWWPDVCDFLYKYDDYKNTRNFRYCQLEPEETFDLFMDGTIRLIDTMGHTSGHQSVLLKLPNTGDVAICGDAGALKESLDRLSPAPTCPNKRKAIHSLVKLRHLRDIGFQMIYSHDTQQEKELKRSPEYYD